MKKVKKHKYLFVDDKGNYRLIKNVKNGDKKYTINIPFKSKKEAIRVKKDWEKRGYNFEYGEQLRRKYIPHLRKMHELEKDAKKEKTKPEQFPPLREMLNAQRKELQHRAEEYEQLQHEMTRNIEDYYAQCNLCSSEYTAEEEIRDAYECLLSEVEAIAVILGKYDYPSRGVLHVYTAVIELLQEIQKHELNMIREDQQAEFIKYKKNIGIANNTEQNA